MDETATIIQIQQPSKISSLLSAGATPPVDRNKARTLAEWITAADLDLLPFYRLAADCPIMRPVTESLNGLKPLRPASLFEMLVIAITEQQLSLAAAFRVRSRLVTRFGTPLGDLWLFPCSETLAGARSADLRACGLSERKAEYIRDLAQHAAEGQLCFESLKRRQDAEVREVLSQHRGFGEWSIQYILLRGLGRPDALPSGDVGLRRVLGIYFADGRRLEPEELKAAMSVFRPFRGLAAFYLSVHWRLRRGGRAMPA